LEIINPIKTSLTGGDSLGHIKAVKGKKKVSRKIAL
jgi:hypothetical protein